MWVLNQFSSNFPKQVTFWLKVGMKGFVPKYFFFSRKLKKCENAPSLTEPDIWPHDLCHLEFSTLHLSLNKILEKK